MKKIQLEKDNWANNYKNTNYQNATVNDIYEISKNRLRERWFTSKGLTEIMNDAEFINNLGKMVILENIVSYHLSLLFLYRNNQKDSLLQYLDNKTLGQIIADYAKLNKHDKKLYSRLKSFNDSRTNLTHKLHLGYQSIKKAKQECSVLINKGLKLKELLIKKTAEREQMHQKKYIRQIKIPKVLTSDMIQYSNESEKFNLSSKLKRTQNKYKITY